MGTIEELGLLSLDPLKYNTKVESPINSSAKAVIGRNFGTIIYFFCIFYLYLQETGINVLSA